MEGRTCPAAGEWHSVILITMYHTSGNCALFVKEALSYNVSDKAQWVSVLTVTLDTRNHMLEEENQLPQVGF